MNKRGQFSVIAAMLVAVVLIATVMFTYSAIRNISMQDEPLVMSAIDETNGAIKQLLGYTVGYYGSVLQVTANHTYAQMLATNYLQSGVLNLGNIHPEWAISITANIPDLRIDWFGNESSSRGSLAVTYNLTGIGISGINYTASCELNVRILNSTGAQTQLMVTGDNDVPLLDLGKSNFMFYRYSNTQSKWELAPPTVEPTVFANGSYQIPPPTGIDPNHYFLQVLDQRGIITVASSFTSINYNLTWPSTPPTTAIIQYVNNNTSDVDSSPDKGTQSNFTAMQNGPDSIYDTLTEGTPMDSSYYPSNYDLLKLTQLVSGNTSDLVSNDGVYMQFRSYQTVSTDSFVAYRDSATTTNTPKGRTWTGDSADWGSQSELPTSDSPVRFARVAYSPIQNRSYEKIVVTLSDDGYLDAYVWDGTAWLVTNNIGSVGTTANAYRAFDITYETTTGNAMLVYAIVSTSSVQDLAYKTWNGTNWSTASYIDDTGHATNIQYYWVNLASKQVTGSNEIALVGIDGTDSDTVAWIWNGNIWGNMNEMTANAATTTREDAAVAYETTSGKAIFGYGVSGANIQSKTWDGTTWNNTAPTLNIDGSTAYWITMKSDPSSDQIMLTSVDGSSDLNTFLWQSSPMVWLRGTGTDHDTALDTNSRRCADFDWEPTGSKGLLVWGTTSGQITYRTFTAPSAWGTIQNQAMGANTHRWVQLRGNPRDISGDVKILGAVVENNALDIGAIAWNGTTFTVIGTNTISSSTTDSYECFEIAFQRFGPPDQFVSEVEFTGDSDTNSWTNLTWTINSKFSIAGVNATFQLYNYNTASYPTSGDGFMNATIGTSNVTQTQVITTNPTYFRDGTGNWKLKVRGNASTQFDWNVDSVKYQPSSSLNYQLDLEGQWQNVNYTSPYQKYLCIKTGTLGAEPIKVDVWNGSTWINVLSSLTVSSWNNASVSSLLASSTLTIRFKGSNETSDPLQDNWQIDATLVQIGDIYSLSSVHETITVESLQNGSMRWLGQNLQLTTEAKPIPPLPVKSIHINQTINGVSNEVPFQIEDWASNYQIPLGLTGNMSVFNDMTMLVSLINSNVSQFTIWWNGSDRATQTPLAYTNRYFTADDPSNGKLTNGKLTLQFGSGFTLNASIGSSSSQATFMRINNQASVYGSSPAYTITGGIIRDIVQQEAEWENGVTNSPNLYAHIVVTLPANSTYYTYQLRPMFVNSTQNRTITDFCPIKLAISTGLPQTENGTVGGYPAVVNGTGQFYNSSASSWTHHWSQFISGTKGAGIMFTDDANNNLYVFDNLANNKTGSLRSNSTTMTMELLPVAIAPVSFQTALDVIWYGAVAAFDGTTPIYQNVNGTIGGLWVTVEYPPTVAVTEI